MSNEAGMLLCTATLAAIRSVALLYVDGAVSAPAAMKRVVTEMNDWALAVHNLGDPSTVGRADSVDSAPDPHGAADPGGAPREEP